jgi:streptomycin 6-kinase
MVRFGPSVLAWCDELPALVDRLAAKWNLDLVETGGGGTSRVFRCRRRDTGAYVWMKLTPDPVVAAEEAEALTAWAGTPSVVTLLEQDLDVSALLLASIEPGTPVGQTAWQLPEAAALLRDLRTFSPTVGETVLRPLNDRVDFLYDLTSRKLAAAGTVLDPELLVRAQATATDLSTTGPVGLVHGDLHPANVLSGEGGMVATDPRPAWGDPDFDAVDWVLDGAQDVGELERRIEELAVLVPDLSPDRVLGWCQALATIILVARLIARRHDEETRFLLTLAQR